MKHSNKHNKTELHRVKHYVDRIRVPVWIFDLNTGELVHCNRQCEVFFKPIQSEKITTETFKKALWNAIQEHIDESSFFVAQIDLKIRDLNQQIQVSGNKLSANYCSLSLLQSPSVRKENFDLKLGLFFCNESGEVISTDQSNKVEFLDKVENIFDILTAEDQILAYESIDKLKAAKSDGKSVVLREINIDFEDYRRIVDIEFLKPRKNIDMIVIIFRESHFQNEMMLEKSRAELAEEINEILKLEIEEHKKTQNKLDETEVLSNSIIDSSLDLILTFDKGMIITEVNRKFEEFTRFDRSKIMGTDINEVLENNGDVENVIMLVNTTGRYEGELICKKKNGEKVEVFASVTLLKNNKNEILGYVCTMRDSTELKKWQSKFAITEERYTDLFENATDLIQGVGIKGEFIYTNKSWYKHLGYSKEDRDKLTVFDIIEPGDRKRFKAYFNKIAEGSIAEPRTWTLLKKNGKHIIVESISNLKRKDGKPRTVRSIMRDVTEATRAKRFAKEQSAKMEAIIETGKIMFWTVNRDIKLTSFNKEYEKTIERHYGKKPKLDSGEREAKDKFASEEYHNFWNQKYNAVFETGESAFFQTKTNDREGNTYYREIFLRPISFAKGEVTEVSGMAIDITDKKLNERKIDQQSAKIQAIFDSTNHIIWSNDTSGTITSFNEVMKKELKERYDVNLEVGMNVRTIAKEINILSKQNWNSILDKVIKGEKIQLEIQTKDKLKKTYIEEVSMSPIYNSDGDVTEMAGIAQNVTFKRIAEQKLREQTAKINAIFDSTAILIWTIDKNMRIVSYNKVFADSHRKLLGEEISIGTNFIELIRAYTKKEPYKNLIRYFKMAFKGDRQQFEGVLHSVAGEKVWMESFFNPIYSENNEIKEISCLSYDITDKKATEAKMRETISEKEILLQEVHHRVKNNLQVISSILNLQSSYVKDENSLTILRESQNRIKSMSFIHESLYQTKDFAHIEFSDYILSLSKNLIHSYSISTQRIKLNPQMDKCFLSLDQAIPCGLIANELISNALKYAFEDEREGEIFIGLTENKNILRLVIRDNGIGLPPDLDYENADSLGLQLVYTLIDQLDATIKVEIEEGTKYLITFEKQ